MTTQTEPDQEHLQSGSRVARNTGVYLLAQVVSWAAAIATVSLIPRRLGETAIGQLAVVGAFTGAISVPLAFGIEQYLAAEIGRRPDRTPELVRGVLGLRLATWLPMWAVSLAGILVMHTGRDLAVLGVLGVTGACLVLLSDPMRAVLVGLEQAKHVSVLDLVLSAWPLAAIPFLSHGPVAYLACSIATAVGVLAVRLLWVGRHGGLRPAFRLSLWWELLRGGLPFMANDCIMQFQTASVVAIVRLYGGDPQVGVVSQAMKLAGTSMFFPTALGLALQPSLVRLADADPDRLKEQQSRVMTLALAAGLPIATALVMLAAPICTLLYGPGRFHGLAPVVQVFAVNMVPVYIVSLMFRFLVARRRHGVWSYLLAGTALVNAGLCFVLIPWTRQAFGSVGVGAGVANVIAEVLSVGCAFALVDRHVVDRSSAWRLVRAVLATAAMAGAIWLTRGLFVAVPAAFGALVFCLAAWGLHVLPPQEEARIRRLIRRRTVGT